MAVKTLTFKFIKKTKFKFDKENFVNKSGKKKILGLQAMSFSADESYHLAPVKISKNETRDSLAKKILIQEHKLYPKAILKVFNL